MLRSVIRCNNLMKTYQQGDYYINAVDRANIIIYAYQLTAIIGASGSGKSTFLHLCGGLDNPSGGEVYIRTDDGDEVNIYSLKKDELTRFRCENFGFVFQSYHLLPLLTAKENILVPVIYSKKPTNKEFYEYFELICERLGIADRLDHLPSELSGGQQQRVAVARALINKPKIIFADEPTGNLDKKSSEEMKELLFFTRDSFDQSMVIVTHDTSFAEKADRVLIMENGIISESNNN